MALLAALLRSCRAGLGGQPGEQGLRVAVADRDLVISGQAVIGVQGGGEGRGDAVIVGGVGAEQDAAGAGERLEGGQGGPCGQRGVEIKAPEAGQDGIGTGRAGLEYPRELGEAKGGVGQEAARVREDDADPRMPVQDAVEDELDTGSRGLERKVRHRRGKDYAVGVQRVQHMPEFLNGAVDIGERQCREAAEPARPAGDQIRGVFVDAGIR
jgi:hypothetical protein